METLLVLGSGRGSYREYIFKAAATRYALVLLEQNPLTWQRSYILDAAQVDWTDQQGVLVAAEQLNHRHTFVGIFTYDEMLVSLTASVAEALGLRYLDRACAERCRDKHCMRQTFKAAAVPSAESHLVHTIDEALCVAATLGYPVVLKPRALGGSIGVVRVDSPQDLAAAYTTAIEAACPGYTTFTDGLLLEEYLDGPEYSVESLVVAGEVQILAVTHKQLGFAPYFEELGHCVSASEPIPDEQTLRTCVVAAHRALGLNMGATHAELRMTSRGPRMIEVAARLGGDLIPHLVQLATGVNMAAAALDIAAGHTPDLQPSRQAAAAVRFLYPRADVRVEAFAIDPQAPLISWLDQVQWLVGPGTELRLPPRGFMSRLGFFVVSGATKEVCNQRLTQVEALLHMELAPLPS